MVMSTLEVRPHNVRLSGSERASVMPPRASGTETGIRERHSDRSIQSQTTNAFSVSGVALAQGQKNATSVQIAERALQTVGAELASIKQGLTRAFSSGRSVSNELNTSLQRNKEVIEQVLESARFDGNRVVDNQLRVNMNKEVMRQFSVPGLNVHRLSDKAEQVRLDFPQGSSVMIQFDGRSDGVKTVKMLDRSLIPLGLRASLAEDGTILFKSSEKAYSQMQEKVMVTGQGHRFPAGQSSSLKLKPEPEGIAELSFNTSSRDGIKQTIAKVNQYVRQTQQGLEQARTLNEELNAHMQAVNNQSKVLSGEEVTVRLSALQPGDSPFSKTLQAVSAQANVKRHSVVALMRS